MTLKQLRQKSGLKQYKIAEHLGISRVQYGNIEKGKSRISSEKIEKLSGLFNEEPMQILRAWEDSK